MALNVQLNRRLEHPNGYEWIDTAIKVGGSLLGGLFGGDDEDPAVEAQKAAMAMQNKQIRWGKRETEPYREAGKTAVGTYADLVNKQSEYEGLIPTDMPGEFKFGLEEFNQYKDPGYQWRVDQANKALNRGMAAGGKRLSGERMMGLMDLNQQMASQEFGAARQRAFQDYTTNELGLNQLAYSRGQDAYQRQYLDQLNSQMGLADMGMRATLGLAGVNMQGAQAAGGFLANAGAYQTAGNISRSNQISQMIGDIAQTARDGWGSVFNTGGYAGGPGYVPPGYGNWAGGEFG